MELQATNKPGLVLEKLGQKAATVGFLSLHPQNKNIMEDKSAVKVADQAIDVSKTNPQQQKQKQLFAMSSEP